VAFSFTAILLLSLVCFIISYFYVVGLYLVRFSIFVKYSVKSGAIAVATNHGLAHELLFAFKYLCLSNSFKFLVFECSCSGCDLHFSRVFAWICFIAMFSFHNFHAFIWILVMVLCCCKTFYPNAKLLILTCSS